MVEIFVCPDEGNKWQRSLHWASIFRLRWLQTCSGSGKMNISATPIRSS